MYIPDIEDIYAASERLQPVVIETPLLNSPFLDALLNARIFIKPEIFQNTGSFKFRGAFNRISQIRSEDYSGGVVASSSGNHGQGIAEAARLCGLKATIVMPSDAPSIKARRTRRSGADIVFYDRDEEDRDQIAADICKEKNALFIHPYNDSDIIAGQGTVGFEIVRQMKSLNVKPDIVLTPCGGGGLTAGVGLSVRNTWPNTELYSVEPENFDDYAQSLQAGKRISNNIKSGSICDALLTSSPGKISFEINRKILKSGLKVSDDEVCRAIAFAFEELKLVLEPGGAVALAALLSHKIEISNKTAVIVLSGGNIDSNLHAEYLKRAGK